MACNEVAVSKLRKLLALCSEPTCGGESVVVVVSTEAASAVRKMDLMVKEARLVLVVVLDGIGAEYR